MPAPWNEIWGTIGRAAAPGFLIPGPREVLIIALVFLAFYGRSGSRLLLSTRYGRMLSPWVRLAESAAPRRGPAAGRGGAPPSAAAAAPEPKETRPRGRLFWALALTAAAAAAAWAATQAVVRHAASLPPP